MTTSYRGGCDCGAIRYEATGEPVFQNHCQCLHCQKRSGTGHGSYLTFGPDAGVTISGTASTWAVAGDSGNAKHHAFCPTCGTPVYLTLTAMPGFTAIHAGSLDEPDRFRPQAVTYRVRGRDWDTIDPALKAFDRMPPAG